MNWSQDGSMPDWVGCTRAQVIMVGYGCGRKMLAGYGRTVISFLISIPRQGSWMYYYGTVQQRDYFLTMETGVDHPRWINTDETEGSR